MMMTCIAQTIHFLQGLTSWELYGILYDISGNKIIVISTQARCFVILKILGVHVLYRSIDYAERALGLTPPQKKKKKKNQFTSTLMIEEKYGWPLRFLFFCIQVSMSIIFPFLHTRGWSRHAWSHDDPDCRPGSRCLRAICHAGCHTSWLHRNTHQYPSPYEHNPSYHDDGTSNASPGKSCWSATSNSTDWAISTKHHSSQPRLFCKAPIWQPSL